jgi:DNA-binding response OmpR family regulator
VLVVDDHPTVREWMTRRLHLADVDALDAATGEDGVAIARREKLDLALIDYRLPGINGVETAVAIQQAGVSLPWILFSGTEDERAGRLAVQNGAVCVLWGQFDLYAEVRKALDLVDRRRADEWVRLLQARSLEEPGTTIGYAAWWILLACASPADLPRLRPWVAFVPSTTYSQLRNAYLRVGVEPLDARDFMRILRALARTSGRVEHVEGQLALGDQRTTDAMITRAGLSKGRPADPITLEEFLTRQRFISVDHPLLDQIRALAAKL